MSKGEMKKPFDPAQYRLAAFDLDGTLLSGREPLHAAVRESLNALAGKGVTVVASSGRNATQFSGELASCFRYAVLSNGSMVLDVASGELIFGHPIERIIALYAIDRVIKLGGSCFLQQGAHMISPLKPLKNILRECKKYPAAKRIASCCTLVNVFYGKSTVCLDPLKQAQKTDYPIYKIQAFFGNAEQAEKAAAILQTETELVTVPIGDGTVELTAPGVSKANALNELAGFLGLEKENIAAFGDGMNDMEMLENAGFSVAMQNGDPRLFDKVDRIAPPVTEDGAARMIRELWQL